MMEEERPAVQTPSHNGDAPLGEKETSRVEAFSDGVFAIAITLLIIDLKVPHLDTSAGNLALVRALSGLWPGFVAFLGSFAAILIIWVNHHGLFRMIHSLDARFLYVNGFLLLLVTFVPFPTAVLAQFLNQPSGKAAAAFYCGTFLLINVAFNLMWVAIRMNGRLLRPDTSREHVQKLSRAAFVATPVYVLALLLSFVNPYVGLVLCSTPWVIWAKLSYTPEE